MKLFLKLTIKSKFISYFEGYFNNQRQAFNMPREFAMIEINHTKLDKNTFRITQKYIKSKDPYRIAIVEISQKNGKILLKSYDNSEDRQYKKGCDIIFEYDERLDRFHGQNVCKKCYVEKSGINSYLMTEAFLSKDRYKVVDKGYDLETHKQIWGSYNGFFDFDRK